MEFCLSLRAPAPQPTITFWLSGPFRLVPSQVGFQHFLGKLSLAEWPNWSMRVVQCVSTIKQRAIPTKRTHPFFTPRAFRLKNSHDGFAPGMFSKMHSLRQWHSRRSPDCCSVSGFGIRIGLIIVAQHETPLFSPSMRLACGLWQGAVSAIDRLRWSLQRRRPAFAQKLRRGETSGLIRSFRKWDGEIPPTGRNELPSNCTAARNSLLGRRQEMIRGRGIRHAKACGLECSNVIA